jgi:hypothetical protein
MKRQLILLLAAFLVAAALVTGCAPTVSTSSSSIGTAALNAGTATNKSISGTLTITGGNFGALVNTTGQVGYLDFDAQIDASTIATGIFLYPLTTAVDAFTPNVRGTALPFTSTVDGTRVYLTINATTATATIQFFVNAATLTADNGSKKLDGNGNGITGEDSDSFYSTSVVGTAPGATAPAAVALVVTPDPVTPFPAVNTAGSLLAGNLVLDVATYDTSAATRLTFVAQDTGSSATPDKISVAGAATVYKNVDGAWTVAPSTIAYAGSTGTPAYTATITLTTAPKKGESYKVVVDTYYVVESQAVLGYVHRANIATNHASNPAITRYYTFTAAGGAQQSVGVASGGADFARYLDITVVGTTPIDLTTVTANSFKVRLATGTPLSTGTAPGPFVAPYSVVVTQTSVYQTNAQAVLNFRLYMPDSIQNFVGGNRVEIAPSVLSIASTVTAQDTLSFGNIGGTDGRRVIAF